MSDEHLETLICEFKCVCVCVAQQLLISVYCLPSDCVSPAACSTLDLSPVLLFHRPSTRERCWITSQLLREEKFVLKLQSGAKF